MRYVGGERAAGCVFCNALVAPDRRESLVLHVGNNAFMLLNRFPYNSGHLMVVPIEHVPTLEDLDAETRGEMMELVNLGIEVCRPVFRCDGFNVGLNIGQVAGAGIADHLHMHLVPRWTGDANFMPILSDTMVLPETLESTHARLGAELATRVAHDTSNYELAAGALVYLVNESRFVLRKLGDAPAVIPKGKLKVGETAADAAIREVQEETGMSPIIVAAIGAQVIDPPPDSGRQPQHAVFFLATASDVAHLRHEDTLLVAPEDLLKTVELASLRDLLDSARPVLEELTGVRL